MGALCRGAPLVGERRTGFCLEARSDRGALQPCRDPLAGQENRQACGAGCLLRSRPAPVRQRGMCDSGGQKYALPIIRLRESGFPGLFYGGGLLRRQCFRIGEVRLRELCFQSLYGAFRARSSAYDLGLFRRGHHAEPGRKRVFEGRGEGFALVHRHGDDALYRRLLHLYRPLRRHFRQR